MELLYNAWRYNYPRMETERTDAALDALRATQNAEPTEKE
jgi:hypothetical protein